jgi:hypothetical protein
VMAMVGVGAIGSVATAMQDSFVSPV